MSIASPILETLPPPASGKVRGNAALLISSLLFLNFFYFLLSSGRVRTMDEVSAAFQVESLAKNGTTAIPMQSMLNCSTARSTVSAAPNRRIRRDRLSPCFPGTPGANS